MDIISTPQRLYHGTTDQLVPAFQTKLLNHHFWRAGRDFGEGFYTTISVSQARIWAHKTAKSAIGITSPCVLELELISIPSDYYPKIFIGESLDWAQFILVHRLISDKGMDPCNKHPDIIIGPMADSDTGKIIQDAVQLKKDAKWFYDQITRSVKGKRLDSLRLGNQVVFSTEAWESALKLVGYYVYAKGRWTYYENSSKAKSI